MGKVVGRVVVAVLAVVAGTGAPAPVPGGAAPAKPKAIVVAVSPASAVWSQPVRITVSITPKGGGVPRGGTVTFLDGDAPIGTATATTRITGFTTSALGVGPHSIRARYEGDAVTAPGTSAPTTVTVGPAPTTVALTTAPGAVVVGEPAELRAVVQAAEPASPLRRPTGTVTFTRGTARATVRVNANGVATWRPRLPAGTHTVTATYDGSATHASSTSGPVEQEVAAHAVDQVSEGEQADETWVHDSSTDPAEHRIGHVFTAGRSGALDAVDLRVRSVGTPAGPMVLTIRTVADGRPTDTVLGTGTLDPAVVAAAPAGWLQVPLSTPAPVTAGTEYAIVIEHETYLATTSSTWMFGAARGTSHPGHHVYRYGTEEWIRTPGWDLLFRTWVAPV